MLDTDMMLSLLCCPACGVKLKALDSTGADVTTVTTVTTATTATTATITALCCDNCQTHYPIVDGIIDFVPDFAPSEGLAQQFMENPFVVDIYESFFRPTFTKLGSTIKYQDEDSWLDALDEQHGLTQVDVALDLAAGTGRYSRKMIDRYQPSALIAADLSMPMLKKHREISDGLGYDSILYIRADAHQLPIQSAVVNRLNCFGALHLFPDPAQAIKELGRVATQEAVLSCLVACEHDEKWKKRMQSAFSQLASFHFFQRDVLISDLESAGFQQFSDLQKQMLMMFSAVVRS